MANVKHRSGIAYGAFLDQIRDPERESRIATWFWGVQEIPDILDRWGHDLPPERIHLVTVPPAGGAPELLWKRFSQVFGLDGLDLDLEPDRANPSLGAPETALIRRINRNANRDLAPADYRPLVRELLAHQTLSRRRGSPRLAPPPDAYHWVRDIQQSWVDDITARGYDVVGDLAELLGSPTEGWSDPDAPSEKQVAGAAVDAITALLLENARMRRAEERLGAELAETQRALDRSYLRPTYRFREKLVRRLQGGRLAGGCCASTGGRVATSRGRRSDRSARSRSRRRRRRPARRPPAPAGRRWWPAACPRPARSGRWRPPRR